MTATHSRIFQLVCSLAALPLTGATVCAAQLDGTVSSWLKISSTSGGFGGDLDDGDKFSSSVALLGDLDLDGVGDLAVGARLDDDGGEDAGCVWILFRNADGTVREQRKISALTGDLPGELEAGDRFGVSLAVLPDLNGDGVEDLAVGSRLDDDGGSDRGAVYICFLARDGSVGGYQKISQTRGGFGGQLGNSDQWGSATAWLGDLDGDGLGELAVGGPESDRGAPNAGSLWILSLDETGFVQRQLPIFSGVNGMVALDAEDRFGVSASPAGDRDADGVPDLFVGALFDDDGASDAGAIYLLYLLPDGRVRETRKFASGVNGWADVLSAGDNFGRACLGLGDVNGDGFADLAGGAFTADGQGLDRGAVWILFLDAAGGVAGWTEIGDQVGGLDATFDDGDRLAISLAQRGDLDGDGAADLIAGAMRDDDGGMDRGAVYQLNLFGAVQASSAARNGAGVNPECVSTTGRPILGTSFRVEADAVSNPSSTLSLLAGFEGSLAGFDTSFGQLLVDPASELLLSRFEPLLGGGAEHLIAIPADAALAGFELSTQGALVDGGPVLCNALDLRLGY